MGKDSLIKSTSKKKADAKKSTKKVAAKSTKKTATKKKTTAKKAAAKTTKKAAAKAPAKSKTTKKAAPKKAAPKKAAKAVKKTAPKKKVAAKKVKQLSVKELLHLKFESTQPAAAPTAAPAPAPAPPSAPPLFTSSDPEELARLRAVLSEQFDMDQIKAAAKAPEAQPAPEAPAAPEAATEAAAPEATPAKAEPEPEVEEEKPASALAEESAYINTEPPDPDTPTDPVSRAAKIGIAVAAGIVLILLAISYNNSGKYYITPKDNAIEIWKGRFSPKDSQFFMILHGTAVAEPLKEVYSSKEVFPLIFDYYLDKADTLLEVPGLPDFDGIKDYLHQAEDYAVSASMKDAINARSNTIERMILLYKADVAMSKGTRESLTNATKLLKQARKLGPSDMQAQEIDAKIAAAGEAIAALKAGGTAPAE